MLETTPVTESQYSTNIDRNLAPSTTDVKIKTIWLFKGPVVSAVMFFFLFLLGLIHTDFFILVLLTATPIRIIGNYLTRSNFKLVLEDQFIKLHQGIISKQQRNIPYAVIQNVFLKQDIADRILGIATLVFENAAESGGSKWFAKGNQKKDGETLGFKGNAITMPGIDKAEAETLKNRILEKMRANPYSNNTSGL